MANNDYISEYVKTSNELMTTKIRLDWYIRFFEEMNNTYPDETKIVMDKIERD